MRHLVHAQEIDPCGVFTDPTLWGRRLGPEDDSRTVEQRESRAVRYGKGIADEDVGDLRRLESDFVHDRRTNAFDRRCRALGPCRVTHRIVNAEVSRGDGLPLLRRTLRTCSGRNGDEGHGEEGSTHAAGMVVYGTAHEAHSQKEMEQCG